MDKNRLKEFFNKIFRYSILIDTQSLGDDVKDLVSNSWKQEALLHNILDNYTDDMHKIILYYVKILYKREDFIDYIATLVDIDRKDLIDVFILILEVINILKIDLDKIKLKGGA